VNLKSPDLRHYENEYEIRNVQSQLREFEMYRLKNVHQSCLLLKEARNLGMTRKQPKNRDSDRTSA